MKFLNLCLLPRSKKEVQTSTQICQVSNSEWATVVGPQNFLKSCPKTSVCHESQEISVILQLCLFIF